MSPLRIVGIGLVAIGILALAYGGFSYTQETTRAEIGPLKLSVKEERKVEFPVWAGIGAIVAGVVFLVAGKKK